MKKAIIVDIEGTFDHEDSWKDISVYAAMAVEKIRLEKEK